MSDSNFRKIYQSALSLAAIVLISSCSVFQKNSDEPTRIRVVDLNGNPREVKRFVPELNVKALADQGYKVNVETGELEPVAQNSNAQKPISANNQSSPPVTDINTNITQNQAKPNQTIIFQNGKNVNNAGPISQQKAEAIDQSVEYDLGGVGPITKSEIARPELEKAPTSHSDKKSKKFNLIIGKPSKGTASAVTDKKNKKNKAQKSGSKSLYIQAGSFNTSETANEILNKNQAISDGKIVEVKVHGKNYYRVLLGPINSQEEADTILGKLNQAGYKDAFVTKNKR